MHFDTLQEFVSRFSVTRTLTKWRTIICVGCFLHISKILHQIAYTYKKYGNFFRRLFNRYHCYWSAILILILHKYTVCLKIQYMWKIKNLKNFLLLIFLNYLEILENNYELTILEMSTTKLCIRNRTNCLDILIRLYRVPSDVHKSRV